MPRPVAGRGEKDRVLTFEPDHVGIETVEDPIAQSAWWHHWMHVDCPLLTHSSPYRYFWPGERDLMAKRAGLRRQHRWVNWLRAVLQPDTPAHVSAYASRRTSRIR